MELVQQKYDVVLQEEDLQAVHRLPNGSVIMRIWKRTPNSAWYRLKASIRTGGKKTCNFYGNFQLTPRRNSLLYDVRQLKKQGKIHKFSTDENGSISVQISEETAKIRIAAIRSTKGETIKTLTKAELQGLVCEKI